MVQLPQSLCHKVSSFPCPIDDIPAVVGHAIQQSSAEAPCISSHKLNMEVIEGNTSRTPDEPHPLF